MTWECDHCGTVWPTRPLPPTVVGCLACGNYESEGVPVTENLLIEMPSAEALAAIHSDLDMLQDAIDDDRNVPERYASSAQGCLAEMDSAVLAMAMRVVHRLMLWQKYESVSPESYIGGDDDPR